VYLIVLTYRFVTKVEDHLGLVHRDTGEVAHFELGVGDSVDEGGFPDIGLPGKGDDDLFHEINYPYDLIKLK